MLLFFCLFGKCDLPTKHRQLFYGLSKFIVCNKDVNNPGKLEVDGLCLVYCSHTVLFAVAALAKKRRVNKVDIQSLSRAADPLSQDK